MKYLYPVKLGAITSCLLAALLTTSQTNAREVCQLLESDPDGDGWGWEMDASCRVTPETGNVPAFQHPRTGLDVNIERIFWVWDDFAGKTISECRGYIVDPGSPSDRCSTCADTESTYQHMTDGAGVFQILSGARDTTVVTTNPGRTIQTGQPSANVPAQVGMSRAGNESQSVDNSSAIDNSASTSSASNSRNGTTGIVSNTSPAGSQTDNTLATNTQLSGGTTGNAAMVNQGTRQVLASANFRWNVDNNGFRDKLASILFAKQHPVQWVWLQSTIRHPLWIIIKPLSPHRNLPA